MSNNTLLKTINEYVAIKNTIYDLYPVLSNMNEEERNNVFQKFHPYEVIANLTFKYPNDLEIYEVSKKIDNKELTKEEVLLMYNISSKDFELKCGEYHMFDFGKRIENKDLNFKDFSQNEHIK